MVDGIISHICGGLGNQMFQYAVGRALSLRLGCPLALNTTWYTAEYIAIHPETTVRTFQLPLFPNLATAVRCYARPRSRLRAALERRASRLLLSLSSLSRLFPAEVCEPHSFQFWPGMADVRPPAVLHGYWQCERYFSDCAAQIRHDFAFPPLPEGAARDLAGYMGGLAHATAVHIRRGDYVSNPKAHAFHGLMGEDYYQRALERIHAVAGEGATLFLFSDDPQWVRANFDSRGLDAHVVDLGLPAHHDMHLMSLCRHHVLANSSFSWWGAWLSPLEGVTVAPRRWVAAPDIKTDDVCPAAWERI